MGKLVDLTGRKFGRLTVVSKANSLKGKTYWNCRCDCGNSCVKASSILLNGVTPSCGCANRELRKQRVPNLTGKKFGKLTVIHMLPRKKGKGTEWLCKCDCGNETIVKYNNLVTNHTKSCGCLKHSKPGGSFKDLTGLKFNNLMVIGRLHTDSCGNMLWNCKCDCGNFITVNSNSLIQGYIKSCGCAHQVNLLNKRFGRLVVKENLGSNNEKNVIWNCKCDCGNNVTVITSLLTHGGVKSCGCLAKDLLIERTKSAANSIRNYPQWFIDELYYEKDKQMARNHSLMTADKVYFNCTTHGKYMQRVADHITLSTGMQRSSCPKCSGLIAYLGSKAENEIRDYILEINTSLYLLKDRVLLIQDKKQEIDIFIPSLNLGIEYNGSPFHATLNGTYSDKPRLYHQQKFIQAQEQGIHLINIFDVDWENNQEKIKQYLHDLIVPCKKIFARKCTIKTLDKSIANEFIQKYHIQGSSKRFTQINYGLYYNYELTSVMSFGKLRLSKTEEDQYELHRYCVKAGYNVIGGASRLLKAFEREYSPKYILSYSDNDYFTGDIYPKLGFEFIKQSTPRYYWFYHGKEIKRETCQLKNLRKLYPELLQEAYDNNASNKEDYVMCKLGAAKVYRSGTKKWVKIIG